MSYMSKMSRYRKLHFRDTTIAITPEEIRELTMNKFRQFEITEAHFSQGHTPACFDHPAPPSAESQDMRYYEVQIEAPLVDAIMSAIGQFHYLGFGPADPETVPPPASTEKPEPR
jgi:hypothetical protein